MRNFCFTTETLLYLVNPVVAVPLLRCVFADASSFGAAHHPHRLPCPPVSGLRPVFVVQRCVAVQGQGPAGVGDPEGLTLSRTNSETNIPTSYLFMCVSVWSKQCSPMRLFPERSRPPLPVYVNSSPRSYSGSQRQPPVYHVCSNSKQHCNHTADAPLRPQSPQPAPANKSHRYSARGSHQREACEHLLRSPEGTGPFNTQVTSVF